MDNELARKQTSALGPREQAMAYAGVGVCLLLLAWVEYRAPKPPPFTGRWGWVHDLAFNAFGLLGLAYVSTAVAAGFFIAAIVRWSSAKKTEQPR